MSSKASFWTGRVLTTLITLFMLLDGVFKLIKPQPVVEATTKLGYPASVILPLGVTLIACTILYAIPRTAVLGAILLTGYLGGAVATHVRVGASDWIYAVVFGVVAWLGIYLRDAKLRTLVPIRQTV
jgi:hypothetical protein